MDTTNSSGGHDRMHWRCCWHPMIGKILWVLALLDLIGAGAAYWRGGEFLSVAGQTWLWFSLVKGVLAMGARGRSHCHG